MTYIDLHTHHSGNDSTVQVSNIFAQDLPGLKPQYFFSAGLHPWHITATNPNQCFGLIEAETTNKNMLAVGECGLDRHIQTDFALQERCFQEQIRLADKYAKPLIIHCVRAYPDLIKLKKEFQSTVPWILHAYNGNMETTKSLIRHGFYFSLGEQMLTNVKKQEILSQIPTEQIFLETDDREISIQKMYLFAAEILKIDEQNLIEIVIHNFKKLFGDDKLVAKD